VGVARGRYTYHRGDSWRYGILTLGHYRTPGNTVSDFSEARVHVQHLGRHRLLLVSTRIMETEVKGVSLVTFEYLQHLKKGVMRTKPTL
jgi:hypothetical protein